MLEGSSLYALAASVVVRVPNLLLPIIATRIFNSSEYSVFAVALVTASAMSAFFGDAIAATISRESYRVGLGAQGGASLAAFFRKTLLASYALILGGVCIWLAYRPSDTDGSLSALATILFVPAYLLPAATAALATASGQGKSQVVASFVGIPISIAFSLFIGATFGIAYFFVTYFVCVILTNLYVYTRVVAANSDDGSQRTGRTLREYGPVFITVLLPFLLGGPVHGLCLSILGRQEGGVTELAVFVAYYPWSILVSVFSGILTNYVIQRIVQIRRENNVPRLKRFLAHLLIGNVAVAVLVGACLWFGSDWVFALYGPRFAQNEALFGWMLICGISAACVSTTSQIMLAIGGGKGLLMCAVLHAVLYLGLTFFFVEWMVQGAAGLVRALTFSLSALALSHMVLIGVYVQINARETELNNATVR